VRIDTREWDQRDPAGLASALRAARPSPPGIAAAVATTIERIRDGGDVALAELGLRFDGVAASQLRVDVAEIERAERSIASDLRAALELSVANVRAVAEAQITDQSAPVLDQGQRISIDEIPVGAAGIYVPGGRAPYPSSVVMGVVPARAAGVPRVVVASPPGESGRPDDAVLAAASIAGADEVYAIGGAQAIAALAYGTESIAAVDVIAGPGSPWVQEAKLQCSRVVGIDGYAGPSELVVVCDRDAPADWIALDVCAQAEHGDDGLLVVIGTDRSALDRVGDAIGRLAAERVSVADATVELVWAERIGAAVELAEALAPEHLELLTADARDLAEAVTTAGCIFVGGRSATAFGDYAAGSNHVLPTGGAGRFSGPLGPADFRRRISRVELDANSVAALGEAVDVIARAEGFPVHGESALARRNDRRQGE
jgi:histidinol dehydrogenase